jgi:hypothetical protein
MAGRSQENFRVWLPSPAAGAAARWADAITMGCVGVQSQTKRTTAIGPAETNRELPANAELGTKEPKTGGGFIALVPIRRGCCTLLAQATNKDARRSPRALRLGHWVGAQVGSPNRCPILRPVHFHFTGAFGAVRGDRAKKIRQGDLTSYALSGTCACYFPGRYSRRKHQATALRINRWYIGCMSDSRVWPLARWQSRPRPGS